MSTERIEDFEAFVAVVDGGSLTAAARHLRRSLQSVSRSLSALERSLGVELVRRTTRRSNPTEAGLAFYGRIKPAVAEIHEAKLEATHRREEPSGLLRIGASVLFAPVYVLPTIAAFMKRYPKVEVDLKLSDRFVDLIEEGIDLAIRIGEMPESTLKARRLGSLRLVVFGAPIYFEEHGHPAHPRDLTNHECVIRTTDRKANAWPFRIDKKIVPVKVRGRFHVDGAAASHAAVALGLGVGNGPLWQVRELVDRGALELILEDFEPPTVPIYAVSPATKAPSAKARLFTDLLAARLKRERL